MENKTFAYIRVSSKEQNIDRQAEVLKQYVKSERDIFIDKVSGKSFARENYQHLKSHVRSGDSVYVKSLDRFGRNKSEIKNELEWFKKEGVAVKILDVPTTMIDFEQFGSLQKSIMEMVDNILIEVLGTFSEQEHKLIKERQEEGIKTAKKKGIKFGRPNKEFPPAWADYYGRWKNNELTAVQTMSSLAMAKATFYRLAKKWESQNGPAGTGKARAAKTINSLINVRSNYMDVSKLTEVFKKQKPYTEKLQSVFFEFFYDVPLPIIKKYMTEENISKKEIISVFNKLPDLAMKNKFKGAIENGNF